MQPIPDFHEWRLFRPPRYRSYSSCPGSRRRPSWAHF